jgi:hypothetical protein
MPDAAAGTWSVGPDGAWRWNYRPMPADVIAARRAAADLPLSGARSATEPGGDGYYQGTDRPAGGSDRSVGR